MSEYFTDPEKSLQFYRDDWRAMTQQIVNLEHTVKTLRRELERERSRNAMDGGQV